MMVEINMIAIFGLGNIGAQYKNTYHNLGFMVLDAFAQKHGIEFTKTKCSAFFAEINLFGQKVLLFKPKTYMNNSGISVSEAVKKFKLNEENVLVVYDDVDIPVGTLRLRENGSAGSHNGMKSIVSYIGTTDFPRLRLGIGDTYYNLVDYVLSSIKPEHKESVQLAIDQAVTILEDYIKQNGEVNRVHVV